MFSILPKTYFNFSFTFILSSANALNLDQSKILLFGKDLVKSNSLPHNPDLTTLRKKRFENTVGKGKKKSFMIQSHLVCSMQLFSN